MKYVFLSIIAALLLSISWPTYGIPFFIFIALVPLLLMEHEIRLFSQYKKKGWIIFGLSYLCFIIWNIVTTGWLYGSKNPDGSHSLMAVVFPVVVNSLLYSLVFQFYSWYKKAEGTYWGLAFFIVIWMGFEQFHMHWELSWPWLNLGNVFSEYPKVIQWYDTLGATGGSFWILLVNVFVFYTLRVWQASRKRIALLKNSSLLALLIGVPILISLYKYYSFSVKPTGEVRTLLLQPDLDPYQEKYTKDSLTMAQELLELAETGKDTPIDFYIAPETALPGRGSFSETGFNKSTILNNVKEFLVHHPKSVFISGISSHRFFTNDDVIPENAYSIGENIWVESYNSALQILPYNDFTVYHKGKLVPGVEIFPYMKYLKPLLGNAMLNLGGTVASLGTDKHRKVFKNPYNRGKAAPIICYESIYGEYVSEYVRSGANFLAIMSNDSWWGVTQGHLQLLSYTKIRAIENRREIARAANSGISAHINALGEIEEDTLYEDRLALYAPIKLYNVITPYTIMGDLIARLCIFILGFFVFYTLIKSILNKVNRNKRTTNFKK